MANAIARKAMAQSVTSSSLAASGWNQVFGNGASQGSTTKVSPSNHRAFAWTAVVGNPKRSDGEFAGLLIDVGVSRSNWV
jgi:hypothetical protein